MRQKYDYAKLLKDYNIPFNSEEAASRGFLTLPCPYCRGQSHKNKGYYGGINIQHNYFRCWKCGKKPLYEVIRLLTGREWRDIEDEYKTMLDPRDIYLSRVAEKPKGTNKIKKVLPKFWYVRWAI